MKKFLSICLVALCSVSAMYAQETPATEANLNNVECGSTVTVSATATNKHFHFDHWVITGFNNGTTTTETINKGDNSAIFTTTSRSTMTGTNSDIEKEELTVTINSNLINWVNTPGAIGTLTFEAFFREDLKHSITIIAVDEAGNPLDANDYLIVSNISEVYENETVNLEVDNKNGSCYVFHHWADAATNGTNLGNTKTISATYNPQRTIYYAVYTNKVNIKVKTANSSIGMGTVNISVNNNPTNN